MIMVKMHIFINTGHKRISLTLWRQEAHSTKEIIEMIWSCHIIRYVTDIPHRIDSLCDCALSTSDPKITSSLKFLFVV